MDSGKIMKEEIMMQVIPIRMIMQVESPDDYISRVRRHVAEQIRQDSIARKNFWMDGLKGITVMLLLFAFAVLVLAGLAAAEPQPVDGGWHRSDEVPVETPTAAPPDGEQHSPEQAPSRIDAEAATTTIAEPPSGDVVSGANATATTAAEQQPGDIMIEPEAAERRMDVGGLVAVGLCGLLALTALWCCLRWGRAK